MTKTAQNNFFMCIKETITRETWKTKCGCIKRFYIYEDGKKELTMNRGCAAHRFGMKDKNYKNSLEDANEK